MHEGPGVRRDIPQLLHQSKCLAESASSPAAPWRSLSLQQIAAADAAKTAVSSYVSSSFSHLAEASLLHCFPASALFHLRLMLMKDGISANLC